MAAFAAGLVVLCGLCACARLAAGLTEPEQLSRTDGDRIKVWAKWPGDDLYPTAARYCAHRGATPRVVTSTQGSATFVCEPDQ
jgi:putative hemolysin